MPALHLEKQLEAVLYSVSIPQGQCLKSLQLLKILLQGTGSKPQAWTEQHSLGAFETRAETKMGLLAIIICCQDKISDAYRELLPVLSEALKSGTATLKVNTKEHSAEVLLQYILGCFFLQAWRDGDSATTLGMACEALALIFETGSLDKFWKEAKDHSNCSHMQQSLRPAPQEARLPEGCESLDSLPTPE
ncbi:hypothetical protein GBA52_026992 [Prunus armeniaca]|nr:hypothetical protein GBA52_026992 [Prunus armeniaca]